MYANMYLPPSLQPPWYLPLSGTGSGNRRSGLSLLRLRQAPDVADFGGDSGGDNGNNM